MRIHHLVDNRHEKTPSKQIILFDGTCNLCNSVVRFIIPRDHAGTFRFASLQSDTGIKLMGNIGGLEGRTDSVVFVRDNEVYLKSDAALQIARSLDGAWPLLYSLRILPRSMRDGVYDWVARNRYRWFGKRETCMIPTEDIRSRFL